MSSNKGRLALTILDAARYNGELLRQIAERVAPADVVFYALTCREFRDAIHGVSRYEKKMYGESRNERTRNTYGGVVSSVSRLQWALALGLAGVRTLPRPVRHVASHTAEFVARYGPTECMQFLRSVGCAWNEAACSAAADGGRLEMLQWLHANGCPWDEAACTHAAYAGHAGMLQWLCANGCPWNVDRCSEAAGVGGHVEVLQWLRPYNHMISDGNWEPDSSEDEGSEWEEDSDDRR